MNWYDDMPNIPMKIQQALSLVNKLKDEIGEKQLIIDALEDSMVDLVNSAPCIFSVKMLDTAFHQQHKTKKSERPMYEFVRETIVENFFPNFKEKEIKIQQITHGGYEGYYYEFELDVNGCKLSLQIPGCGNISKKHMSTAHYGQYALYDVNKKGWNKMIKLAYHTDTIAKAAEEFIKEWKKKNEEMS